MLKDETGGRFRYQFDNLPDVLRYLRSTPRNWTSRNSESSSHSYEWTFGVDYERACRMAEEGWEEGIRELHALACSVPNNTVVTREYSVAGEMPDIPRYLAGDPFNMVHRGRQRVPKPTMTIVVGIGANCNVGGSQMANYGAAITALVDRLESRHVRVELIACWRSVLPAGDFAFSWTIKRAEDALDLGAVAFGLGHPAMMRRLGFAVMERAPRHAQVSNYGMSKAEIAERHLIDVAPGALFIGGLDPSSCSTLDGALKHAERQINAAYAEAGHEGGLAELRAYDEAA